MSSLFDKFKKDVFWKPFFKKASCGPPSFGAARGSAVESDRKYSKEKRITSSKVDCFW